MDFGLDPITGDLIVEGGMTTVTKDVELLQKVNVGLTINIGEFFTHINHGLPWLRSSDKEIDQDLQYFLGEEDSVSAQYIVKELDNYLQSIAEVTSVTSSYTFTKSSRTLKYTPLITGLDGVTVEFPPYSLNI